MYRPARLVATSLPRCGRPSLSSARAHRPSATSDISCRNASQRAYGSSTSSNSDWTQSPKARVAGLSVLSVLSAAAYLSLSQKVELEAARSPITESKGLISAKEIMKHNREDDCWVIIHDPASGQDKVWDVTEFLEMHPGGADVILANSGKDATKIFAPVHPKGIIERTLSPENLMGFLDPTSRGDLPDDGPSDEELRVQAARRNMPPIESLINLDDFTKAAEYCLPHTAWAYYDSAADDEYTKRENNYAYRRYWFNPRSLHKVRDIDLSSTILGGRIKTSLPVYISPAAMAKLGHPDGELNLVRAASTGGIMHGISINASCSLEEMDEVYKEGDPRIFQIYLDVNRKNSEELVKKVEKMGFEGIMFTVDSVATGNRELDKRSKPFVKTSGTAGISTWASYQDPNLCWDDVTWLKSLTKLPIIVKGIQNVEDVALAAKYGADAVILSNHGGRTLDFSRPPIDVLYELRQTKPEVFSQLEVWVDGGVRRGTDVVKALCLGAKAVGLGRPFLYGNSAYGQEGAEKIIQIMNDEISTTIRNLGVTSLAELKPEFVRYVDRDPAPLPSKQL